MSEQEQITNALKRCFETERIVFWYDWNTEENKAQFSDCFDALHLEGVEKIKLNNDEFSVKYRILRSEPEQKFLIYQDAPRPNDIDNWLLDVLLSNKEFHANQNALWLAETGLDYNSFRILPEQHNRFFRRAELRRALKETATIQDSCDIIRLKMLAVLLKTEDKQYDIEHITVKLFNLYAQNELTAAEDKIKVCNLYDFLFKQIENKYAYHSNNPSITDFIIQLFLYNFQLSVGFDLQYRLNNDAQNLFSNWKNNRQYTRYFKTVSEGIFNELNLEDDILDLSLDTLSKTDCFKFIEERIFCLLIEQLKNNSDLASIPDFINKRINSVWFDKDMYNLLYYAALFLHNFNLCQSFNAETPKEAVNNYVQNFYLLDMYYRNYFAVVQHSSAVSQLSEITQKIEQCYDTYLTSLNDCWQRIIDKENKWEFNGINLQKDFFNNYLKSLSGNNKIVVIISDGLRYEIGKELSDRVNKEERYKSDIDFMLSALPSYTQLGMAALLPHNELTIKEDRNCYIDGNSSAGIENRGKLLSKCGLNTAVIKAEEFMSLNGIQARNFLRGKNIVYVYEDKIDQTAHNHSTEKFTNTQKYIERTVNLIKKFGSSNVYNFIITADHGSLYNNFTLLPRHFIDEKPAGVITFEERRVIAGKNLICSNKFKKYSAKDLSLSGDLEFAFPKSVSRLRKSGSDDKYVHGGLSLQEVVLPVIKVNYERHDNTSYTDIEVMQGNNTITNSVITIKFYQCDAIGSDVMPRTLNIGFYNDNNELISNQETITFNSSSNIVSDREKIVTFRFGNKLAEENNKNIFLCLNEYTEGTNHIRNYKKCTYKVRITFQPDF